MAIEAEEEQAGDPVTSKAVPSPKDSDSVGSKGSYCPPDRAKEFILSVARKYSAEPIQSSDPGVWGVLTAISKNSRKRPQGTNIVLTADKHCFGRLVGDARFRIDSTAVSGSHCELYRKKSTAEDAELGPNFHVSVCLKDTSTNGTYINWERLKKGAPAANLQHGDIVSLAAAPQHELAFAFVYREVPNSVPALDGATLKRKADEFGSENKRLKGIGIGAPEGPISLDDVRSLQRSNTDLRKQLESHVLTIQKVVDEKNSAITHHKSEMKELKETVSKSYLHDIKELRCMLDIKQKELVKVNAISTGRQQAIEDLNERLSASLQSRIDADEIINNQKGTMSELERQLDEERNLRKEEREKALADLKAALRRAQLEAQEELKRQSDVAFRQERELKEVMSKLQESDKESRLLVEALRSKLEDTRESLVTSEKKVRQLESHVLEEKQLSTKDRKKAEALEQEMKRLKKKLEDEKVAREDAWAKVSALELEMAAAIRDLSIEKQRFQGARERIILRETQLRAFYSTTEEISALFAKQEEQLKAMRRTLEDEENYENLSVDIDLCTTKANTKEATVGENSKSHRSNNNVKESSAASTPRVERIQVESSSDEASVTEKHECDFKSQEGHDTQEQECASGEQAVNGGFGSDINGIDTAPILDGEPIETEKVVGTESPAANFGVGNIDLNEPDALAGDTMQLDNDTYVQEDCGDQRVQEDSARFSQSNRPLPLEGSLKAMEEDTEGAIATIRTADLLASEVAGSWAISTAPSVHGENDSPRSSERDGGGNDDDDDGATRALPCSSDAPAAASQTIPAATATMNWSQERQALNAMIEIVAPEFKEQFRYDDGSVRGRNKDEASTSDSDTEGGDDVNGVGAEGGESISDADTQEGSDVPNEDDNRVDDGMNGCDDATQQDSLG